MSLPLIYRQEAFDDLASSTSWYDRTSVELGNRFRRALRDALDKVKQSPESFGKIDDDIRACKVKKFPYVIYFSIECDHILVIAIVHGSRDPGSWRRRV